MTDDRLDLRLFESGEHETVKPEDDVHTRRTLPMDARQILRAASLGVFQDGVQSTRAVQNPVEEEGADEFVRIDSMVNVKGAQVMAVASDEEALKHLIWQGPDALNVLRADGSTFAIDVEPAVCSLKTSRHAVLVGCLNGELYHLNLNTLRMTCLYAQVRRQPITAVEFFDDHQSCLFVSSEGTVYVCRDLDNASRVRRLKRSIGRDVRLMLLHHATNEFVWIEDQDLFSGDLIHTTRRVDTLPGPISRGVFSPDGSLLYLLSQDHTLFVYSWVGDCRCLYQKQVDPLVSDLFISATNTVHGVLVRGHRVMVKPLS